MSVSFGLTVHIVMLTSVFHSSKSFRCMGIKNFIYPVLCTLYIYIPVRVCSYLSLRIKVYPLGKYSLISSTLLAIYVPVQHYVAICCKVHSVNIFIVHIPAVCSSLSSYFSALMCLCPVLCISIHCRKHKYIVLSIEDYIVLTTYIAALKY